MLLYLLYTQAFAAQPCFDLVDRYAADNCLSYPTSLESDTENGPVIAYLCDLGDGLGEGFFAVFSLATDAAPFFEADPLECSGGDLWIDPGDPDTLGTGVGSSWLSWSMYHEWDDERDEGNMTYLDDWFIEQSIINFSQTL